MTRLVVGFLLAPALLATQASGQEQPGVPRNDTAPLTPVAAPAPGTSNYRVTLQLPDGTREMHYSVTVKNHDGASTVTGRWPRSKTSGEITDVMTLEMGTLLVRKESLRREVKSSKPVTADLDFTGNKVTGTATSVRGITPVSVELPAPVYPGGVAIDVVIGCLPLAEGFATTYRYWDVQALKEDVLRVEVLGGERVSVSAGSFDCWKVQLTKADRSEKGTVWIAKDSRTPVRSSGSKTVGSATIYNSTELIR